MKNAEFKKYYNEMKDCFTDCPIKTLAECQAMDTLYRTSELLTDKQDAAIAAFFAEIELDLKDSIIAKNAAIEMAKASTNGGWKKGRKHNAKSEKGGKQSMETKKNTAAQTATTEPVEVLKGEVIDTKTEKQVTAAIERISAKVEKIGKGYLDIVGDVARLRALKAWKITGHKSMYELCADKFGMSRATVGNLEAIFARYGNKETFKLTDEAEGLSVRQMLANIKSEKTAELEDKNGEPAEGDSNGAGAGKGEKKGKIETLTSISFEISAEWSIDEMLEELKAQLTEQGAVYPDGATLTLTITK